MSDKAIQFTISEDQKETICNHFGKDPSEMEDYEVCELLDQIIDDLVE